MNTMQYHTIAQLRELLLIIKTPGINNLTHLIRAQQSDFELTIQDAIKDLVELYNKAKRV